MRVGDRVSVSGGHGFGGPGTIRAVVYRVEMDHEQPAGGKWMNAASDRVAKVAKAKKKAPRKRQP